MITLDAERIQYCWELVAQNVHFSYGSFTKWRPLANHSIVADKLSRSTAVVYSVCNIDYWTVLLDLNL